jgi:hypothetical protein
MYEKLKEDITSNKLISHLILAEQIPKQKLANIRINKELEIDEYKFIVS